MANLEAIRLVNAGATTERARIDQQLNDIRIQMAAESCPASAARAIGDVATAQAAADQIAQLVEARRPRRTRCSSLHDRVADELAGLLGDDLDARGRRPAGPASGPRGGALDRRPGRRSGPDLPDAVHAETLDEGLSEKSARPARSTG